MLASFPNGRRARRFAIGLVLASSAPMAIAQYATGAVVQPLPGAGDPAEQLATALRTLAVSPNDLAALLSAGRNALTLGDPNAAVGFFGHASELAPRDGRVKAGLGGALVALEKPRDALRYFQEAAALGVPDVDLATDRGLAYDLIGEPARAQRDYQTVLAAHPDDDPVRRRLALSQGIAGDRAAAIATLDPLIRKRDIAAWRAQTFVLAMTGDAKGANDITRVMLPQQATMLQPFLVRLSTLSPADKARAVHFGEMPAAGRNYSQTQLASVGPTPTYTAASPASVARPAVRSDLAPVSTVAPAAVRPSAAPALAPAPQAGHASAAPVVAAAAAPPVVVAKASPQTVVVNGVTMRRVMRSPQDIFGLGMPFYEYIPARVTPPTRTAAPAAAAVRAASPTPRTEPQAIAAAAPPLGSGTLGGVDDRPHDVTPPPASPDAAQTGAATAIASRSAGTSVAASTSEPQETAAPELPLGSSALGGHYDLPHGATPRRAVPRAAQATARPATTTGATSSVADAATPPATAHGHGHPVEVAQADTEATSPKPVRSGRHVSAAPADDEPAAVIKGKTKSHGGKAATTDDDRQAKGQDDDTAGRHGRKAHSNTDADDESRGGRHRAADERDDRSKGKSHADAADDDDAKPARHGKSSKKPEEAAPKIYVQVAGGANRADMDKAWAGVKSKAPDLMKGRKPATTPLHATNRLLVGPFKDEDAAQAFVNKMAGKGLSGFTVKTAKGQKVESVDTDR